MEEYNYNTFNSSEYDFSKNIGLDVGDVVPDFNLSTIESTETQLFKDDPKILVLEIGSVTCPLYSGNIKKMQQLIEKYPSVNFAVLYVREAHPGSKIGPHSDLSEKILDANTINKHFIEKRKILIDDVEGSAHKQLGLLPNSVFVIGEDRKILYRLNWNNIPTINTVLKNLTTGKSFDSIKPRFKPAPPTIFVPVLLRAGFGAFFDFITSLPMVIIQRMKKLLSKGGQF